MIKVDKSDSGVVWRKMWMGDLDKCLCLYCYCYRYTWYHSLNRSSGHSLASVVALFSLDIFRPASCLWQLYGQRKRVETKGILK